MKKLYLIFLAVLLGACAHESAVKENYLPLYEGNSKTTLSIKLEIEGHGTEFFLIDTGASYTVIPSDVVAKLVESGQLLEAGKVRLLINSHGHEYIVKTYMLKTLKIGDCTLKAVRVMDVSNESGFVLGANALRRLMPITFDPPNIEFGSCPSV